MCRTFSWHHWNIIKIYVQHWNVCPASEFKETRVAINILEHMCILCVGDIEYSSITPHAAVAETRERGRASPPEDCMNFYVDVASVVQPSRLVVFILQTCVEHLPLRRLAVCVLCCERSSAIAEAITESLTAAPLSWLFLLAVVWWAPSLVTKAF